MPPTKEVVKLKKKIIALTQNTSSANIYLPSHPLFDHNHTHQPC